MKLYGGGLGIRTLATVTRPNDLANRPLQPLEYHSMRQLTMSVYYDGAILSSYFFNISSTALVLLFIIFV